MSQPPQVLLPACCLVVFFLTQVEEKIFRAPETSLQSMLEKVGDVVASAEELNVGAEQAEAWLTQSYSVLGAFLHPTNTSYKECELPLGCYCCPAAHLL